MLYYFCQLRRLFVLASTLALLSGCVSTPSSPATAHVYVTAGGTVSYRGAPCSPEQLPVRLAKAGVGPVQEIRVHMDDIQNARLRSQIATGLLQKGFKRILFVAAPRASSEVVGEPDTRTESPAGKDALPSQFP